MSELGSGGGSSYPGSIDTDNTQEVNSPNAGKTKARAEVVNDLAAAVVAIQTELGVDPAGTLTDVKTFLQAEHGTDGTHAVGTIITPPGVISVYGAAAAPTGYLLCDGDAVDRTTYASLFSIISTIYGVGDGSTTFNVPDLRGRFPLGKDNMGGSSANRVTASEADNLGQSEGTEAHTLVTAEVPAHTHEVAGDPNNNFGVHQATASTGGQANITGSTGGDGSHENMPPYLTISYIIKT